MSEENLNEDKAGMALLNQSLRQLKQPLQQNQRLTNLADHMQQVVVRTPQHVYGSSVAQAA